LVGPCGDVTIAKAVQISVTQDKEQDPLIASLSTHQSRARLLAKDKRALTA
jgi:hypothetical protein